MKKPCILVVDDDAALRELITLRLEANGFRVEAVGSGEAALALPPGLDAGPVLGVSFGVLGRKQP